MRAKKRKEKKNNPPFLASFPDGFSLCGQKPLSLSLYLWSKWLLSLYHAFVCSWMIWSLPSLPLQRHALVLCSSHWVDFFCFLQNRPKWLLNQCHACIFFSLPLGSESSSFVPSKARPIPLLWHWPNLFFSLLFTPTFNHTQWIPSAFFRTDAIPSALLWHWDLLWFLTFTRDPNSCRPPKSTECNFSFFFFERFPDSPSSLYGILPSEKHPSSHSKSCIAFDAEGSRDPAQSVCISKHTYTYTYTQEQSSVQQKEGSKGTKPWEQGASFVCFSVNL